MSKTLALIGRTSAWEGCHLIIRTLLIFKACFENYVRNHIFYFNYFAL
jgi:hypothetical protein